MKLALINPKGIILEAYNKVLPLTDTAPKSGNYDFLKAFFGIWSGISLGLLIVAGLTPDLFEIDLIDENFEEINFDKQYDLIAITSITQQIKRAYEIADEFRKRGITVVLGGIHATLMPQEAKRHSDSVIIGESEEIWPVFIKDFLNKDIQPFYRNKTIIDLNNSPIPRYDLLNEKYYKIIWVQATRGCPKDCYFCSASKIFGTKYRHKKIDRIIEEINYIKKLFNKKIAFADDNLFIQKDLSLQLVKELIPLKINWFAQTDISIAENEKLLSLLHESGCKILFIGFESINKKNLKGLDKTDWKLTQLKKYKDYIKKIQSYGIGIMGSFIFGLENDDISVFKKTSDFIIENNLFASQFTILTPLPGTGLRKKLEKENRLISNDWSKYTFLDVNFKPLKMTTEELYKGTFDCYQRVYSKKARLKIAWHFKNIYKEVKRNKLEGIKSNITKMY
ncbi:MAG: B12-binding domain-containing radical SAM protein [bacterium]